MVYHTGFFDGARGAGPREGEGGGATDHAHLSYLHLASALTL